MIFEYILLIQCHISLYLCFAREPQADTYFDGGQGVKKKAIAVVSLHHSWRPLLAAIHHFTLTEEGQGVGKGGRTEVLLLCFINCWGRRLKGLRR